VAAILKFARRIPLFTLQIGSGVRGLTYFGDVSVWHDAVVLIQSENRTKLE
jgi:hypothetical protein